MIESVLDDPGELRGLRSGGSGPDELECQSCLTELNWTKNVDGGRPGRASWCVVTKARSATNELSLGIVHYLAVACRHEFLYLYRYADRRRSQLHSRSASALLQQSTIVVSNQ